MKLVVALAFLQTTVSFAESNLNLAKSVSNLEKQKVANEAKKQTDRRQHGRVLATYEHQIMENTAAALGKLDNISVSAGEAGTKIGLLTTALNATQAEVVNTLEDIKLALNNGSSLVNTLESINTTLSTFFRGGMGNNGTLSYQLSSLFNLLETKLTNLERIIGYDDYPPFPANLTGAGGRFRRSSSSAVLIS